MFQRVGRMASRTFRFQTDLKRRVQRALRAATGLRSPRFAFCAFLYARSSRARIRNCRKGGELPSAARLRALLLAEPQTEAKQDHIFGLK
jgi:hypothetical protein